MRVSVSVLASVFVPFCFLVWRVQGGPQAHVWLCSTRGALPRARLSGANFQKGLFIVTLHGKYTRALTFEHFCQALSV